MRVLLFQFDGALPNLALMRLAAYYRGLGYHVELRQALNISAIQPRLGDEPWDLVFGSLIFEWTRPLAASAAEIYPQIALGGTGWDFVDGVQVRNTKLPPEAEIIAPDYSDYRLNGAPYPRSIGFTQRGCRLACSFCVVPRKEGKATSVGSLADMWRGDPWPRELLILDNDFFGNPFWRDVIAEAVAGKFKISLIQGINARLLNDETAEALASTKIYDDGFHRRRVYTAWDGRKDERTLFRGLEALKRAGFSPDMMMVYMLIGHEPGETLADRDYRRAKLREFGARPYPMPFIRDGELGDELVDFQRFVIQRADLYQTFEQFRGRSKGPRKERRISLPLFGDV